MNFIDKLNFDAKGLIPAIIQEKSTGEVLTLCYMNKEALARTIKEKVVYVFRRSHGRVMIKGETSGCTQAVKEVRADCANNSVLIKVKQKKAACHEGFFTCYFRRLSPKGKLQIKGKRLFDPKKVYCKRGKR